MTRSQQLALFALLNFGATTITTTLTQAFNMVAPPSITSITATGVIKRYQQQYHHQQILMSTKLSSSVTTENANNDDVDVDDVDVDANNDDVDIQVEEELPLKTYNDFKEKFEALSFLSSLESESDSDSESNAQNAKELCTEAQRIFDKMFEEWYMNRKDELEPTVEIYNLLVAIYSNLDSKRASRNGSGRSTIMKTPEQILQRMENGSADNVPLPTTDTYISIIKGWQKANQMNRVEATLKRLEQRYILTNDSNVYPTIEAYNTVLTAWLKSGLKVAPVKAEEILLKLMQRGRDMDDRDDNNLLAGPDTKTFYLVMSCFLRSKSLSRPKKQSKINEIIDIMKEWEVNHSNDDDNDDDDENDNVPKVDSRDKSIANLQIKLSNTPTEAESILFNMIDLYQKDNIEQHRPDAASFINTINAWRGAEAPQHAMQLLDLLTDIYHLEQSQDKDAYDLKPDRRVYSAVQNVWSRSREKDKAQKTKDLLLKLIALKEETGDSDYTPQLRQWNNVLNACVYTKGSSEERKVAMQILVETFNQMRTGDDIEPNHVTYAMFLKGCVALLPPGEKQQSIIENVFRKCCRDGHVSEFVFATFVESSSSSLCEKLLGGDVNDEDGVQIPESWARNV
jgi:hypothetical protein